MFKIRKVAHRRWPVVVKQLVCDESGQVAEVESTFVATFLPFTEARLLGLESLAQEVHPDDTANGPSIAVTLRRNADTFAALIAGWGPEVTDDAGQPVPFTEAELRQLVTGPEGVSLSTALHTALGQLRFGVAPAKNAPTSLAPGLTPAAVEVTPAGERLTPAPTI
jgi:hypothetical protein